MRLTVARVPEHDGGAHPLLDRPRARGAFQPDDGPPVGGEARGHGAADALAAAGDDDAAVLARGSVRGSCHGVASRSKRSGSSVKPRPGASGGVAWPPSNTGPARTSSGAGS
ncbi:Uncharacterised protein [Mycobacteroides abscessus]|nr:Uncharacterised protein [Mycobacteroides abscessus]